MSNPAQLRPVLMPAPAQANLADILERVLDKGIVITGDIRINLLDVELLTIKLRLLVVSVERAREMGIDWWARDPLLSSGQPAPRAENRGLRDRLDEVQPRRPHRERTSGDD